MNPRLQEGKGEREKLTHNPQRRRRSQVWRPGNTSSTTVKLRPEHSSEISKQSFLIPPEKGHTLATSRAVHYFSGQLWTKVETLYQEGNSFLLTWYGGASSTPWHRMEKGESLFHFLALKTVRYSHGAPHSPRQGNSSSFPMSFLITEKTSNLPCLC